MNRVCPKCQKTLPTKVAWYGLHKSCFKDWFRLSEIEEFLDIAIRSSSQNPTKNLKINSSFFHGKFRKYSSRLGGTGYILKVQQKEYPELPVTEYVCNQIYENLRIKVPPYHLIRFPEDEYCFVTKNFMHDTKSSTLTHIYHFLKEGMNYDCETLINIIGNKTGRRIEQEKFAYLTLADSLIGNNDRHGRNLGFIQSAKTTSLAPFYDNPSALGVEEHSLLAADLQPRGSIFTKHSTESTMRDYIVEWERLGFNNVVKLFRRNFSLNKIEKIITTGPLSQKRQKALLRLITSRGDELCNI